MDPHALLLPYRHRRSPVHRLPAGPKLAAAVAGVVGVVLLPRAAWLGYAAVAALLAALVLFARLRARDLLGRLLLLEPLALGVALLSLLPPGGLEASLAVIARTTLCLSFMVLLTLTTRLSDVLASLRRIRMPSLLVTTLLLASRYVFLLVEEAARMRRARRSRTFRAGRAQAWRASASIAAHLLVRALDRAERVHAAMRARGWRA